MYNNHVIHFWDSLGDFHIPLAKLWVGEKSTVVSNFHLTQNIFLESHLHSLERSWEPALKSQCLAHSRRSIDATCSLVAAN